MLGCGRAVVFLASHPCASFSVPSVGPNTSSNSCQCSISFRSAPSHVHSGEWVLQFPDLQLWGGCGPTVPAAGTPVGGSSLWVCGPVCYLVWLQATGRLKAWVCLLGGCLCVWVFVCV